MGNTPSAPSSKEHNRLSKPRTNTNSPFGSPKVDIPPPSPANTKYADVNISDAVVRFPTGDHRTRQDARQQLRAQLTSPIDGDVSQESDEVDSLGELATQVRNRLSLSRSNSLVLQIPSGRTSTSRPSSLPDSKVSSVSDTRTIDLEAAISILQELRKNASPEDLAALRKFLSE